MKNKEVIIIVSLFITLCLLVGTITPPYSFEETVSENTATINWIDGNQSQENRSYFTGYLIYVSYIAEDNATYVVTSNDDDDSTVQAFYHNNCTWSELYTVDEGIPAVGDSGATPRQVIKDNEGYYHILYHVHNGWGGLYKSVGQNISEWGEYEQFGANDGSNYEHIYTDDGDWYIFYRTGGGANRPYHYRLSTDNGDNWGAETTIFDFDDTTTQEQYVHGIRYDPENNYIHFSWCQQSHGLGGARHGMWYAYWLLTNHSFWDVEGKYITDTTLNHANTNYTPCKLFGTGFYTEAGGPIVNSGFLGIDENNYPWVEFTADYDQSVETEDDWGNYVVHWDGDEWIQDIVFNQSYDGHSAIRNCGALYVHNNSSIDYWAIDGNTVDDNGAYPGNVTHYYYDGEDWIFQGELANLSTWGAHFNFNIGRYGMSTFNSSDDFSGWWNVAVIAFEQDDNDAYYIYSPVGGYLCSGNNQLYTLVRYSDSDNITTINDGYSAYNDSGNSYTFTGLDSGTTYYYSAWSFTVNEGYSEMEEGTFTTEGEQNTDVTISSINNQENNTIAKNRSRCFNWSKVSNAISYQIRISNTSNFVTTFLNMSVTEEDYSVVGGYIEYNLPYQYNISWNAYHYYQVRAYLA